MKKHNVGIIGIKGFGTAHADQIIRLVDEKRVICTAFADPYANPGDNTYDRLMSKGASGYRDYELMLDNHPEIEMVVISTPIHLHAEMSIKVLEKGFNVFLEKPPAVTIQDIDSIMEAAESKSKFCAVDFLHSSGEAFRQLLEKIREGVFGRIISVKGFGLESCDEGYYARNPWAGKILADGKYVLDGTVNNPFSHLLQNCLIAAGGGNAKPAVPGAVRGELYKGYGNESEDTSCLRFKTENNVDVLFLATNCGETDIDFYITVHGEKYDAVWSIDNTLRICKDRCIRRNGMSVFEDRKAEDSINNLFECKETIEEYRFKKEDLLAKMYRNCLDVLERPDKDLICPIDTCRNFVLASNGAFESSGGVHAIPAEFLHSGEHNGRRSVIIENIRNIFLSAYDSGKLISDRNVDWAVKTKLYSMKGYKRFNLFRED